MKLVLGRALYDPGDPLGRMFCNFLATFAEFEAVLIRMRARKGMAIARARGNCEASSPNCPTDSSGNSAACMPRASIPPAISPSFSPSQDQPSIEHSTGALPLSVRSCPLPESTRSPALRLDARLPDRGELRRGLRRGQAHERVPHGCGPTGAERRLDRRHPDPGPGARHAWRHRGDGWTPVDLAS